jgi:transposase
MSSTQQWRNCADSSRRSSGRRSWRRRSPECCGERTSTELNGWLRSAGQSKLQEFVSFACGLSEDYEAVKNALRYEWSNGQLEGQVNRLKLKKA